MPEARLQRTRASLPDGYQFGDGRPTAESLEGATLVVGGVLYVLGPPKSFTFPSWHHPHENFAEQLAHRAERP